MLTRNDLSPNLIPAQVSALIGFKLPDSEFGQASLLGIEEVVIDRVVLIPQRITESVAIYLISSALLRPRRPP